MDRKHNQTNNLCSMVDDEGTLNQWTAGRVKAISKTTSRISSLRALKLIGEAKDWAYRIVKPHGKIKFRHMFRSFPVIGRIK